MRCRDGGSGRGGALLAALVLSCAAGTLEAQRNSEAHAVEVAAMMTSLRTLGGPGLAVEMLRQQDRVRTRRELDDIADSLVSFVRENQMVEDRLIARGVARAVSALGASGAESGEGTLYPGAQERLVLIAKEVPSHAGGALVSLIRRTERATAVPRLRALATENAELSVLAIDLLDRWGGSEGQEALLTLYREQAVTDRRAKRVLDRIATKRGFTPRD